MYNLIILILSILLSLWAGVTIYHDPGYVLVTYSSTIVEMPLWFAVGALILGFSVFYMFLRFVWAVFSLKKNVLTSFRDSRRKSSAEKTQIGIEAYFIGDFAKAEKYLLKGISYSEIKLLNYILAAKSAQELNSESRRDKYLKLAYNNLKGSEEIISITEAKLNLEKGELDESLNILNSLSIKTEHPKYVLSLLKEVYLQLEDWDSLASIIGDIKKHKIYPENEFLMLAKKVYLNLLSEIYNTADVNKLESIWEHIPKQVKLSSEVVSIYAKLMLFTGKTEGAIKVITESLKYNWDTSIVTLFGYLHTDNIESQIKTAEKWLKTHEDDPYLLLALGKLHMENKEYEKARPHLERSLALKESVEVYSELGCLMDVLDDASSSLEYFKRGTQMLNPVHRTISKECLMLPSGMNKE